MTGLLSPLPSLANKPWKLWSEDWSLSHVAGKNGFWPVTSLISNIASKQLLNHIKLSIFIICYQFHGHLFKPQKLMFSPTTVHVIMFLATHVKPGTLTSPTFSDSFPPQVAISISMEILENANTATVNIVSTCGVLRPSHNLQCFKRPQSCYIGLLLHTFRKTYSFTADGD